ncbi:MAG: hypothetical protein DRQ06_03325 [Candidatus Hydrothermota bacterium]|nr:MAG: hypothetical protein DRQ06_03325 [Candidatus Hydrothermae bacterium]RKZ04906.1 MAG: hypothetical protein DRQ04_00380 [Candidatus Hydrothermae bacterium]
MNGLDFFIVGIIGLAAIRGFFRGFVREFFSLLGIALGIYYAANRYSSFTRFFEFLKKPFLIKAVSFILIFLIIYLLVTLIGVIITRFFKLLFLGFADRILGTLFGAIEGMFLVAAILYIFTMFPWGVEILRESKMADVIFGIVKSIVGGGTSL